jgi:hypothetical protein
MDIVQFLPATILGYISFHFVTNPRTKINRKLPVIKLSRIQVSPTIRIKITDKTIQFHHWFNFSLLLLISAFTTSAILDSIYTRGFLVGAIIQGLRFPDRHIIQTEIETEE